MDTKKAVLFDLDGTLIDTASDFIRIIRLMCDKYDYPCPLDSQIREQVSAGSRAMVQLMFGNTADFNDDKLAAYRQEFLDLYEADICVDSRLFEGLDELLTTLEQRSIPWGIVTNKPRYLAQTLLDRLNLSKRCAVLVCPDDVEHTKPSPEPMFLACNALNIAAKDCIYVGDHLRDIQAGNAANMLTVAVKYGYLSADDKANLQAWQADIVVDTPKDLVDMILSYI
ncbi:HAD-IA family hydrolase [Moraxella nasovis]|uniref:HAD family hydrolase n=1 Tax=Moraxella nasovis TaxID=2904121 RepID=UPI001F611A7B|nr:HAD-IA family hydrolase [Moraxella nasovis]UNU72534.1 HAD-IA family hydrolase [Moraxella nasovis]